MLFLKYYEISPKTIDETNCRRTLRDIIRRTDRCTEVSSIYLVNSKMIIFYIHFYKILKKKKSNNRLKDKMEQNYSRVKNLLTPYLQGYDLKDDEDIFARGLINSLFVMQLVLYIEKEFDIVCQGEDLDMDNFRSINKINDFVSRKQMAVGS
ncbi:MAG: hypothetical protein L0Y73_01580 [Candidatus Aminicenantes bacterium]|nr:hypothetical protein [Candidatus Aminicenantes bacterium]